MNIRISGSTINRTSLVIPGESFRTQMADQTPVDLATWLKKEGAIGLIVSIDNENGNIVKELQSKLHVTDNTLTDRLREARNEQDLLQKAEPFQHHDGRVDFYQLTTRGERLRELLESTGIDVVYRAFKNANRILKEAPDELHPVIEQWDLNKEEYDSKHFGDIHMDSIPPELEEPEVDFSTLFNNQEEYDSVDIDVSGEERQLTLRNISDEEENDAND